MRIITILVCIVFVVPFILASPPENPPMDPPSLQPIIDYQNNPQLQAQSQENQSEDFLARRNALDPEEDAINSSENQSNTTTRPEISQQPTDVPIQEGTVESMQTTQELQDQNAQQQDTAQNSQEPEIQTPDSSSNAWLIAGITLLLIVALVAGLYLYKHPALLANKKHESQQSVDPVNEWVADCKQKGYTNQQIADQLHESGYDSQKISELVGEKLP